MSCPLASFPFSTPYDPSEDPPTSIDPLGTVAEAERLAEVLLPGVTGRMWRARLLTFSAVTALVADRVVTLRGHDDVRVDARLAFERLYVSALVRHVNDEGMASAIRRVPGTDRARLALRTGEPLTRSNFLKGQSINGPTGVMARLARNLGIVDDDGLLGPRSLDVLLAWSKDEELPGVLDDKRREGGEGSKLVTRFADATDAVLRGEWPGDQSGIWAELVNRLRPDRAGRAERRTLVQLLWKDPTSVRGRFLDLLKEGRETWIDQRPDGRAVAERAVLRGVEPGDTREDQLIATVLEAIDVYEQASAALQAIFDAVRWYLSAKGAAALSAVLSDARVAGSLERARRRIPKIVGAIEAALAKMEAEPSLSSVLEPLRQVRDDLSRAGLAPEAMVEAIFDRHDRVQREKRKGRWIERGERLVLMPGFGLDGDAPPKYDGLYLHPLRVANTYSMLTDLGVVRGGHDAEAQDN